MILAGSGIAAGGTGNANFLEIQINIPPEDDNDPSQDDDDPPEDGDDPPEDDDDPPEDGGEADLKQRFAANRVGGGLGVVWCITFWLRCILVYHRSGHILYIFYLKHIVSEAKNINYLVLKWQVIESRGDQWGADWDEIMEGEDEVPSPGFHQPPSMSVICKLNIYTSATSNFATKKWGTKR